MSIDVHGAGAAMWRQRVLVALVFVAVAASVTLGVWAAPKTYAATATLSTPAAPLGDGAIGEGELDAMRATLAALTDSTAVVDAARQRLGSLRTAAELRAGVEGRWASGTVLVTVTARDHDPRVAARVANTVAAVLVTRSASAVTGGPGPSVTRGLDVGLVDLAVVPSTPDDPDLPLVAGLTALAALVLVAAAVVVRDRRTHTVDDAVTVETTAAAPLLAHLAAPADLMALPTLEPGTALAGAFANLRASVVQLLAQRGLVLVVVAGIAVDELNVYVGANLAVALAAPGRSVLLVDGRMGERFGQPLEPEPDTVGLYDVLAGAPLAEATSPGPVDTLDVLPSGTWGHQPVEELLRSRFAELVATCEGRYAAVVVLGPPLQVCHDARVMAASGALLLTVPEGRVPVSAMRRYTEQLRSAGAALAGVVLVRRPRPEVVSS